MAEDQIKEEPVKVKEPLRGGEAAKATLERLQKKGILPIRQAPKATDETQPIQNVPAEAEDYDHTKKAFPQEAEERAKILKSYPGEETIPAEVKRELTEEARRLNTMAMAGPGEAATEKKELPHVPPFADEETGQTVPSGETVPTPPPTQHVEAKGGSEPLKRILKAQEEMARADQEAEAASQKRVQARFKVPPEASFPPASQIPQEKLPPAQPVPLSTKPPNAEEGLRQQFRQSPQQEPKQSFLARLWNRLRGRS